MLAFKVVESRSLIRTLEGCLSAFSVWVSGARRSGCYIIKLPLDDISAVL